MITLWISGTIFAMLCLMVFLKLIFLADNMLNIWRAALWSKYLLPSDISVTKFFNDKAFFKQNISFSIRLKYSHTKTTQNVWATCQKWNLFWLPILLISSSGQNSTFCKFRYLFPRAHQSIYQCYFIIRLQDRYGISDSIGGAQLTMEEVWIIKTLLWTD